MQLEDIIAPVLRLHYRVVETDPTQQGEDIYVDYLLKAALAPKARAQEAANLCEFNPIRTKTALQEKLCGPVIDGFLNSARAHPSNGRNGQAFAETMVAELGAWVERVALEKARRLGRLPERELQFEEAREREAEIDRNRRRPPRKPLYPV